MKKFVCLVCGYVHNGDEAPASCPICQAPAEKFKESAPAPAVKEEASTAVTAYKSSMILHT